MIGIIDYKMGNLRSVQKAFEHLEVEARICSDPGSLDNVSHIVLPGVGAFRDAIAEIRKLEFDKAMQDEIASGKPLLGICLGLQLLFETSYEDGEHTGLGIIPGTVERFQPESQLKIPHMGWNAIEPVKEIPLLNGIEPGDHVYFVHSYFVVPTDTSVIATQTTHGTQTFTSIIGSGNVYATQFHPEKSQQVGLKLLKNFANLTG